MVPSKMKTVAKIMGTGVTNGETVTANIDRLGWDYAVIDVVMGTSNNATNNPSTLKLSQGDTTDATAFANLTGFVGDTDFTIANVSTSLENTFRFNVDCRGLKRYLKVTATPITTQAIFLHAALVRGKVEPDSATEYGVTQVVNG